jgi:hypothetical protein
MSTFAVLATGPSLTAEQVDKVRGLRVVAVSDAYRLALWAEALVSADKAWWLHHRPEFAGRRFSALRVPGMDTELLEGLPMGTNSGLRAVELAVQLGATRVLLLGFDLGGTHFFGEHPAPLKNTNLLPGRFEVFKAQFASYKPRGVEIINCTPGSALTCYPKADLDACLA